jgi:hypothetical protein
LLTIGCLVFCAPYKALEQTRDFKKEFHDLDNYYNVEHHGDQGIINLASGAKFSGYGGNTYFILDNNGHGQFCFTVDGQRNCKSVWFGKENKNIILGIGESQKIVYKKEKIKILLFIPVGTVDVMSGLRSEKSSLSGTNFFLPTSINQSFSDPAISSDSESGSDLRNCDFSTP